MAINFGHPIHFFFREKGVNVGAQSVASFLYLFMRPFCAPTNNSGARPSQARSPSRSSDHASKNIRVQATVFKGSI